MRIKYIKWFNSKKLTQNKPFIILALNNYIADYMVLILNQFFKIAKDRALRAKTYFVSICISVHTCHPFGLPTIDPLWPPICLSAFAIRL
mgnify:CR=1 FL=1